MNNKPTELRKDLISNEWVIVSPKRGERPNNFKKNNICPFCDIKDQEPPKHYFYKGVETKNSKKWTTVILPNKYPVFKKDSNYQKDIEDKFYTKVKCSGFHDLIVTKEHDKFLSDLPISRIKEFFSAVQLSIKDYRKHKQIKQIAIFHNRGERAGASQPHPHYQSITLPIIEREFKNELSSFKKFNKKNKQCLQCKINDIELKINKRIIVENEHFIAFCPFAPKTLFQIIVSPKRHFSSFEEATEEEKESLAKIFKIVLGKYDRGFKNLNYNFFLHNAPLDKPYPYFHCYWSFFPRVDNFGGMEIGFGLEISSLLPEDQAEFLRKIK